MEVAQPDAATYALGPLHCGLGFGRKIDTVMSKIRNCQLPKIGARFLPQ
jgi:hypothetical protein